MKPSDEKNPKSPVTSSAFKVINRPQIPASDPEDEEPEGGDLGCSRYRDC